MCGEHSLSMGSRGSSLLEFIEKLMSCIPWESNRSSYISREFDRNRSSYISREFDRKDGRCNSCFNCQKDIVNSHLKYGCQSCGRLLCGKCARNFASLDENESCELCYKLSPLSKKFRNCSGKVYPSESPRRRSEPSSPSFSGERFDGCSPRAPSRSSDASISSHLPQLSSCRSTSRCDDDEGEESTSHFFSTSSEYFHDASDVDFSSISARNEACSFISVGSIPSDSSSRINFSSSGVGPFIQHEQGGTPRSQNEGLCDQERLVLEKSAKGILEAENVDDLATFLNKTEKLPQSLDFENNGLIWCPPPPDDADAETETSFFTYDDEDDEIGNKSDAMFSRKSSINSMFDKHDFDNNEPLKAIVQGYFRALVTQLMQGEDIIATKENFADWLEIVTTLACQAASFIRLDTGRGGSMDPCDYVKVKCVASGTPYESKLVKGIVCTKNIKHKRMTTQYKNAKLLILGGALEYQRTSNQLASFDTLLQQENDHLKTIVSKIEAHRPNLLLVEKSVSSFAQEHLLSKDISLVLNVKRPLLERIARCSGATITPSTDHLSRTRLGYCELFHLEKISEDHEPDNLCNKKPSKTLMFFEGCPRRLGCTVVLRGSSREELKKVKQVVQYAVFAAHHLSLETSFLADEGASLPNVAEIITHDKPVSSIPESVVTKSYAEEFYVPNIEIGSGDVSLELGLLESLSELDKEGCNDVSVTDEFRYRNALLEACDENLALDGKPDDISDMESLNQEVESGEVSEVATPMSVDEASAEYYSANSHSHESILVSFSSHCMLNGTVCERSRLIRVKFYGPTDKPLGRFLRDDLFDKSSLCRSCKESPEDHIICYTHLHGNLTVTTKCLASVKLPGERDGKIWMWHRCLRCAHVEGVPPATRRVVMSDAAWGLSFGKFLELSFSNHATGNRVASCGHSLQRDCLRFYGFGDMVALFQYSPINILSVHLPPRILEFGGHSEQIWLRKDATELLSKAESLYAEISGVLEEIKKRSSSFTHGLHDASELHNHVLELNDILAKEMNYCKDFLRLADKKIHEQDEAIVDILEINRLKHSLVIGSRIWNQRLCSLDSLLKRVSCLKATTNDAAAHTRLEDCTSDHQDNVPENPELEENSVKSVLSNKEEPNSALIEPGLQEHHKLELQDKGDVRNLRFSDPLPSAASILSDTIDSSWSGADLLNMYASESVSFVQAKKTKDQSFRKLLLPSRVYSFDSALRHQERISKEPPPGMLSAVHSFHASGDYRHMVRDPVSNLSRPYSQVLPRETETPTFVSSISLLPEGARLIIPQNGQIDTFVTIYDNEPTSVISYALGSKEYKDRLADRPSGTEGGSKVCFVNKMNSVALDLSTWQSLASLDLDYAQYASYGSEEAHPKSSAHLRISFEDESSNPVEKVRFSVTCYFAKQFDALRGRCCPSETDFIRSLSRCKGWSAQGGKSNVYFAKSFDERFIIKQVTKTELESFNEFSPQYFKYLSDALDSGSPTCLAKVLGIYQVVVKNSKSGKEIKMDLMVMENLFFKRSISKVYDLKGSTRSRYNSDTEGTDKVLLDTNLLETLRTNPIFLGSKAKRVLERAVWNDTSFLASVDVMDYSLLVGVDEERKELVVGIIDFMRQYTWDKHLETWVKASGILGGPKNASPTIVSPKQYKKRFRKAMTTYFLTVPDQ